MSERFTYPSDLPATLESQAKLRLGFWLIFLSPFWFIAWTVVGTEDLWIGVVCAIGASGGAAVFEGLLFSFARRTRELVGQSLEFDGTCLRQVRSDGKIIGEIDLGRAFSVSFPYSVWGNAVYQVTQTSGGTSVPRVEFSSAIGSGERLVREILRHGEWPPGNNSS